MGTLIGFLESLGLFAGGLLARLGLVLAAMAALLLPVLLVWALVRGFAWARRRAQGLERVAGLSYRPGLLYAEGHTWVKPEKGRARVGIDDLAQRMLPWAVSVRLPRIGSKLRAHEPAVVISAGGREAVVRAPFDGTVVSVNPEVSVNPALVKSDAYARGWLFAMRPESDAIGGLRSGTEAVAWLEEESARLHRYLETRLGIGAADGGELLDPMASYLLPDEWRDLTESFLGR